MTTRAPLAEADRCPVDHAQLSLQAAAFTDPAIQRCPNAFYRALRAESPVHFDEKLGVYLVARYDDLNTVFRDPVTYSLEKGYYSQMAHGYLDELKAVLVRDGGGWFPDVVNVDPPRHARARALTLQAFTAHRVKALEQEFERSVDKLIDRFIDRGEIDGLQDLALPMAIDSAPASSTSAILSRTPFGAGAQPISPNSACWRTARRCSRQPRSCASCRDISSRS